MATRKIKRRKPKETKKRVIPFVNHFEKKDVNDLRFKMLMALERMGQEIGMRFEIGNIRYTDFDVKCQVFGYLPQGKPQIETDYEKNQKMQNLYPLGKIIDAPRINECKILGLKPRARKYPLIVEQIKTGKRYRLPLYYAQVNTTVNQIKP